MAETLGMLCDKLTIVKLKEYHTENKEKKDLLNIQCKNLTFEIDEYIAAVFKGEIKKDTIKFESNKVYNESENKMRAFQGEIGELVSSLATINCELWHEQEKVFEFEKVKIEEKDNVIKKLAVLNLERNQCIDKINRNLYNLVVNENK